MTDKIIGRNADGSFTLSAEDTATDLIWIVMVDNDHARLISVPEEEAISVED